MEADVDQLRRTGLVHTARALIPPCADVGAVAAAGATAVIEVVGGGCVIRLASADRAWLDAAAIRCTRADEQAFVEAIVAHGGRQAGDAGLNGAVFSSGRALVMGEIDVNDYRLLLQPEFWPVLDRYRVVSTIAVPLRHDGEILGTLTSAHFDDPTPYTDDRRVFVEDLATLVASSIERAQRTARGETDGRVGRVSMFCEMQSERPYLVWNAGRTYCSDSLTLKALFRVVAPDRWETAITDPTQALDTFAAAFAAMDLRPQIRMT